MGLFICEPKFLARPEFLSSGRNFKPKFWPGDGNSGLARHFHSQMNSPYITKRAERSSYERFRPKIDCDQSIFRLTYLEWVRSVKNGCTLSNPIFQILYNKHHLEGAHMKDLDPKLIVSKGFLD